MTITETADLLLELIHKWIRESEDCARELQKMAEELESLRQKCNAGECVGSTVSVVGAVCFLGAGVATLFTGGAAAPLLGLAGGVYTGVGITTSLTSKLIDHFSSSKIKKEAQKKEESNSIAKKIKEKFEQLKKEVKEKSDHMDPDDLDQLIMTVFMAAVGRHSGNSRVIGFLKDMSSDFGGGRLRNMIFQKDGLELLRIRPMLGAVDILSFFGLEFNGKILVSMAVNELIGIISTAFETVVKGGAKVVGGAVGLGFALHEAINRWEEQIKSNHVTEASQSLRDTASSMRKMTRKLKKQLGDSKKELERWADVKWCIENKQRRPEDKRKLIEDTIEVSNDELIQRWLMEISGQNIFFELLDMFSFLKNQLIEEGSRKKINIDDIHITFVAHGAIQETSILADCLLPLPSIKDVILYSPWNCLLSADAAYGIATGCIQPEHREFSPLPDHLPNGWNSMVSSRGEKIPVITVSSLPQGDKVWNAFLFLQSEYGEPLHRVVLPFLYPEKVKVPFFIITLALSLVLWFSKITATVHLATCLGEASSRTCQERVEQLKKQYAYTRDKPAMTMLKITKPKSTDLYRALKAVFD